MDNILEQIQSLTDKFNNLFEVEGLGEPSGDVPPSTNKIKKDKKTKDGKVELVSVEDELFPKEGNAKEQFRQKVIDKINGMIQGTATLEDLLQLVRSKQVKSVKEGFEGAIELLEDIMTAIDKSSKSPEKKEELKRKAENNQEKELHTLHNYKKLEGSKVPLDIELKRKETKNTKGEHETDERRAKQARSKFKKLGMFDKGYEQARDRFQRALDVERGHSVKEGFEGAIEILEDIHAMIDKHGDKIGPKSELHDLMRTAQREASIQYAEEKGKPWGERWKDEQDFEDRRKGEDTKNYKGQRKTTEKQFKGFGTVTVGGAEPNELEKKIRRERAKRDGKPVKEGFEGAIELLEEIINEVSVGALARATENNFKKRQEAHKKSTEALKKAHDNYEEQSKKHPEDEPALYNALDKLSSATRKEGEKASHANDLANLNLPKDSKVSANKLFGKADKTYAKRGKEVDKALDKGKGRGDKEFDASMKKYSRAVDLAVADPVVSRRTNGGANESFEQAIAALEDIMTAIDKSDKSPERKEELKHKAVKASAKERKEAVKRGQKPTETENQAMYRVLGNREERSKDTGKHNSYVNPSSFKNESFSQAISQIEDLINCLGESKSTTELSSVAKKVLPQREAEAKQAHANLDHAMKISPYSMINGKLSQRQREAISNALNKAQKADNKVEHAKSYLERPKEKQSSGIKFDKILCSHEDKTNEGLFIEDGRGDLIDDVSKTVTGKTVKQHLQDIPKKLIKKKEERALA